jgi:outer membrane lipoprotein-sorting protein
VKLSKKWTASFVVPSVIVLGSVAFAMPAAAVDLPDLTPQELLSLMDGEVTGFSGTVVKTSNIGLPALEMSSMMSQEQVDEMAERMPEGFEDLVPQLIEQNALTQLIELAAGTHTMRVYASELGVRVQVLDPLSQRDFIVNDNEFWAYDAGKATALTGTFDPQMQATLEESLLQLQVDAASPEAVVDALLEEVSDSTVLSVGDDHSIAGRSAYELIATPLSDVSLIDSIVVSIDSETGMALDVKVFSVEQSEPAFALGFESIRFETPDAALFSFTPPAGTTVEVQQFPEELRELSEEYAGREFTEAELENLSADAKAQWEAQGLPAGDIVGENWESIVYLASVPADVPLDMLETELFADLMTDVDGGKVFSTPIVNVLITDSGEVYAGAVTIAHLLAVAAR